MVVFLQTAIEVIYKFLLPKFKWRAQPTADYRPAERQIQQDAWCSARIARVSQQYLYENFRQTIEKEQWPPTNSSNLNTVSWKYHAWGATHEAIWNLHPKAKTVSVCRTKKIIWDNFLQVQLTKLSRFRNSLTRLTWRVKEEIVNIFLYSKTRSHLRCLCCLE